jgi:hypothetical protein
MNAKADGVGCSEHSVMLYEHSARIRDALSGIHHWIVSSDNVHNIRVNYPPILVATPTAAIVGFYSIFLRRVCGEWNAAPSVPSCGGRLGTLQVIDSLGLFPVFPLFPVSRKTFRNESALEYPTCAREETPPLTSQNWFQEKDEMQFLSVKAGFQFHVT